MLQLELFFFTCGLHSSLCCSMLSNARQINIVVESQTRDDKIMIIMKKGDNDDNMYRKIAILYKC